jgi:indole-3-glycerol phosphate synthase
MTYQNYLAAILERKRREIVRRRALGTRQYSASEVESEFSNTDWVCSALRRNRAERPKIIAEIKMRSPSAGIIRDRAVGAVKTIARSYVDNGAAAVSVLCDGPGFGGTPLDVRRVAAAVSVPILFKEFVLDEIQIRLAKAMGAHLVLYIARALSQSEMERLVGETIRLGLVPLVEVANNDELRVALATRAPIIGVNARDLRTFRVDANAAKEIVCRISDDRIAVYMSGVSSNDDLMRIADTRADAVLVGEALMRAESPGQKLKEILSYI